MSKDKVVYLIGAGASIGSFPIVKGTASWDNKGLAECLLDFSETIKLKGNQLAQSDPLKTTVDDLVTALNQTGNAAREFGNVDSYAKYLFHTGKRLSLHKLKIALTFYFVSTQVLDDGTNSKREKRYLNFITSLISDNHLFPKHVKILSWNYDYLLQKSASIYREEAFHEGQGASVRTPAFIEYFPRCGYQFQLTHKDFVDDSCSLLHLNGIAGLYVDSNNNGNGIFKNIFLDIRQILGNQSPSLNDLLRLFHGKYMNNEHLITFAWEKGSETQHLLTNTWGFINSFVKGATTLVVIGYSFPFYNRETDNKIFEILKPTLKKIYFQDPHIDGEFLRKRYDLPTTLKTSGFSKTTVAELRSLTYEIEHITYTDQFYIPVEV